MNIAKIQPKRDSMSEPIIIIDSSEVREGKLDDLKAAMKDLVKFAEANEPEMIAYNVYLSEDGRQVTVLQVHPNSASAEFHMKVAGPPSPSSSSSSRCWGLTYTAAQVKICWSG